MSDEDCRYGFEDYEHSMLEEIMTGVGSGSIVNSEFKEHMRLKTLERISKGCPFFGKSELKLCLIPHKLFGLGITAQLFKCKFPGEPWECPIVRKMWGMSQ